jgi:hypothetical protein
MGGSEYPLRHDQRAVTQFVIAVDIRLPGPLALLGIFANQCLDVIDYSSGFGCRQRINFRKK